MKALGMISGVGSMLIGAKAQGWDIIGNIEWRPYYHTGTFEYNFPGAFMVKTLADLDMDQEDKCMNLDLIIGHTECGNFSNLRAVKREGDIGDIPEFVEAVQKLKPKFFVMDNLPKSLLGANAKYWAESFPEYDIHFEWINNFGYGNIQKHRRRLFVIGSLKELGFYFIPGEQENKDTMRTRLSGIPDSVLNNDPLDLDAPYTHWSRYHIDPSFVTNKSMEDNKITLREFQDFLKDYKPYEVLQYYNRKGEQKKRIGFHLVDIDRAAPVISGGGCPGCDNHFRSDTLMPFTIRERARIQGCPDDFVFLPTGITTTIPERKMLIKQTGKFMPVEFCTFATGQIKAFLMRRRNEYDYTGKRLTKPNPVIDENKFNYCQTVGYTNQKKVCQFCGSKEFCKTHKNTQLTLWPEFSKTASK